MKNGLKIFLVFAVVLVLALAFGGVFKSCGTTLYTLQVNSTNTTIIVRDNLNNVVNPNNGQLEPGETYTIEIVAHNDYELKVFKVNELDQINNLVNNKFSFVCTQNTTIYAVSVINSGEPDADTYSLMYQSAKYYPSSSKTVTDIVLRITSKEVGTICELRVGESYEYLVKGEKYTIDAYSLENEYSRIAYTTNNSLAFATFPRTFSAKNNTVVNIKVCTIPVYSAPITCVGSISGAEVSELTVGETFTISDNAPTGYKTILYVNGEETAMPYTFTYTEDVVLDYEIVEDTGITINPSEPSLVGWAICLTVYGSDCDVQIDILDCTAHSPCLIKDCESCHVFITNTFTLTESEGNDIALPAGSIDDLYSVICEVIPPDNYCVDYYRLCDMYQTVLLETNELPILSSDDNCRFIEIYLKQI